MKLSEILEAVKACLEVATAILTLLGAIAVFRVKCTGEQADKPAPKGGAGKNRKNKKKRKKKPKRQYPKKKSRVKP